MIPIEEQDDFNLVDTTTVNTIYLKQLGASAQYAYRVYNCEIIHRGTVALANDVFINILDGNGNNPLWSSFMPAGALPGTRRGFAFYVPISGSPRQSLTVGISAGGAATSFIVNLSGKLS